MSAFAAVGGKGGLLTDAVAALTTTLEAAAATGVVTVPAALKALVRGRSADSTSPAADVLASAMDCVCVWAVAMGAAWVEASRALVDGRVVSTALVEGCVLSADLVDA